MFWFEAAARSIETYRKIHAGYEENFKGTKGDVRNEASQILDVANQYAQRTIEANRKVLEVLTSNWGWLDPDDSPELSSFLVGVERQLVEIEQGKKLPIQFYFTLENALGAPITYRDDLVKNLREKLTKKQTELSGLSTPDA